MTKPSSSESNKLSLDHRPESHQNPAKKQKVDDGDHTDDDEVGTATDRSMSQNPRIQRYLVAVEYIGTRFYGAQQQSDRRTVEAFHKFIGQPVSIFCSSRTKNEGDVAVIDVRCVAPDFHSRYKALERTYFYRLLSGPEPLSSFEKDRAWHVPEELDLPAMQVAQALSAIKHAKFLSDIMISVPLGQQDAKSPIRNLDNFSVTELKTGVLHDSSISNNNKVEDSQGEATQGFGILRRHRCFVITARARSFLYHQVRLLVGVVKSVGTGDLTVLDVERILEAKTVSAAKPMAPACGLYLAHVAQSTADPMGQMRNPSSNVLAVDK
ncbi:hypothetical protein RJ639_023006, partial [Escallonia herrerae]